MTRRELAAASAGRAQAILDQLAAHPEALPYLPLTNYPTPADFTAICGEPRDAGWTWREWRAVNEGVIELLRDAGKIVHLIPITADQYFAWLASHGLRNLPQNRAQFIQDKRAGFRLKPKPDAL